MVELASHSLRGLSVVLDTIDDVWAELNPDLDIGVCSPTVSHRYPGEADRRYDELAKHGRSQSRGGQVVPQRSLINQAAGERVPIHSFGYRGATSRGRVRRGLGKAAPNEPLTLSCGVSVSVA